MSGTRTATATRTEDVAKVMSRMSADIKMIADSTRAWTDAQVQDRVHDIETLAMAGYLESVDLTLLDDGREIKAARFVPSERASGWANDRPGGVLWPRVTCPRLRVVLTYTSAYDAAARVRMSSKLKIGWVACHDDTSHSTLNQGGGRSYASNAYGMRRTDWAA